VNPEISARTSAPLSVYLFMPWRTPARPVRETARC
jgi:hypothetical protein